MKYVLVIPDGVADEPQPELDGRSPLAVAQTPNCDAVVQAGLVGRTDNVPASMPSGSDVGTMSLFGYDPLCFHSGRAPLEAAAQGIQLQPGDWALRCNLVTTRDGMMESFTAHQVPTETAARLLQCLQRSQCGDAHWKFYPGVSYRNLLIYRARGEAAPFDASTQTVPPHDLTGQPLQWPSGAGADILRSMMERSSELFAQADANQAAAEAGAAAVSQIWLWGQGQAPQLPTFVERFGVRGAVITAVDLLRGIGRLIGWDVLSVEGATGYTDTDYAAKGRAAIAALKDYDLVVVHVEATDEASHEGDVAAKITAMEAIDREIVGPVFDALKTYTESRIMVCPDHPTFLRTRTHSHGDCPFAIAGTGVQPDEAKVYSEAAAAESGLAFPAGHELMPVFLNASEIRAGMAVGITE